MDIDDFRQNACCLPFLTHPLKLIIIVKLTATPGENDFRVVCLYEARLASGVNGFRVVWLYGARMTIVIFPSLLVRKLGYEAFYSYIVFL